MPSVSKDLAEERDKVNFSVEEFTNWYYGGAKNVTERRAFGTKVNVVTFINRKLILIFITEKHFLSDPDLNLSLDTRYLSYKERYEEAVRRSVINHKKFIKTTFTPDFNMKRIE
jgi:Acyl-coenzyme A oxidase N-terminal